MMKTPVTAMRAIAAALLLGSALGRASGQTPRPALDSAWAWGFEGVVGSLTQVSVLRQAAPWRAWVMTGGLTVNSQSQPFGQPTRTAVNPSFKLGYRRWRAREGRATPWLECGAGGSWQFGSGTPSWAAGPYVAVGDDYFVNSRISLGGSVSGAAQYNRYAPNFWSIGASAGTVRLLARLLL